MDYNQELFGLHNKVAAVLGGSGVLGGSMASALAKSGANVAVMYYKNKEGAQQQYNRITKNGGRALVVPANSQSKKSMETARDAIVEKWGHIDILLNAPGTNSTTPVMEIEESEWEQIIGTNLKGIFLACQVFGEQMITQGTGGSIINISSVSSEVPLSKVFTYSISKSGLNSLTKFLAREWAPHGIRVNALAPGFFPAKQNQKILTEERTNEIFNHTPMGRFGKPQELSGATIWLASERASSFVTGSLIYVDGGFTAQTI